MIHFNKFSSSSHAELGAKFIEKCFFLFNSIFFSIFRFPKGGDDFSFQMVHEGIDRLKKGKDPTFLELAISNRKFRADSNRGLSHHSTSEPRKLFLENDNC